MAFVHLHSHSDFSILDGAARISDIVGRAVELGMPAVALTDHGYMFGIPNLDLECRRYNEEALAMRQWKRDLECFQKSWELTEPEADPQDAPRYDRAHAQWASDRDVWESSSHDIEAVRANRPPLKIKPIFGCEAYFIKGDHVERGTRERRYHLILLAKNETGYHNLLKCMSEAAGHEMMYYGKPHTTLPMLRKYHEGVICLSACVQGVIPQCVVSGQPDEARQWALTFKELFGDDFYLEVQDHGNVFEGGWDDRRLDEQLVRLGRELGIKVVATNDFHYLVRDDAPTQDLLSCIGKATTLDDPKRMRMRGSEYYLKSEQEMRELFSWLPEAVDNTVEVADKCDYELDWSSMYLPSFPGLRPGETAEERFRAECERGLAKRYGDDWRDVTINGVNVRERFEYEYQVICDKGFANYFLIVQDYVQWAKDNGIGVGPGRGSAAGAIVAYALNITTFDPLENGLMFERFLSPQRSEMPDIDMDFDDEHLQDVLAHVREVYGEDHVCKVITYSTIKAKQAINDAARVLGQPVYVGQRLSKMLSNDPKLSLENALHKNERRPDQYSPDFERAYREDQVAHQIIDAALSIEGMTRGEGVHACATLIAPTPVTDHVPTKLDTKGNVTITQYEGHSVADMGLLKMDFLGLRTLTVINKALDNIRAAHPGPQDVAAMPEAVRACLKPSARGVDIDVDLIDFSDPKIYELLGSGHTAGVFQVESAGMTATIKNMQPREYKQIVALIALYRPGPLGAGMVTSYINRMNGKEPVVFYDDRLSSILDETYGTIVYQEQVMQISVKMSGFSAGESDSRIRKPVAKKKIKLLTSTVFHWDDGRDETTYDHWMNGAQGNGYERDVAQKIWDDVLEFASYAFNKSHSAGYAILVMQTAWLKAHFPKEFMASVLTSYMGKTEKIVHYVTACRREGIEVLPPDINESGRDFTATREGVRFGFAGIRGVGAGVGEVIMRERERGGPFRSLHDFVDRLDGSQANRRVVEALIKAGAFDSTGYPRKQLLGFVDKGDPMNIVDAAARRQKDRASGQSSFFDLLADVAGSGFDEEVPPPDPADEWDRHTKLAQEHEVLGLYVSDHPLAPYEYALSKARDYAISELSESEEVVNAADGSTTTTFKVPEGSSFSLAGMVPTGGVAKKVTKKGDQMAIVTLEDMEGEISVVVFPKAYKECAAALEGQIDPQTGERVGDVFIKVVGKLERGDRGDQLIASSVESLELSDRTNRPKVFEVCVSARLLSQERMELFQSILVRYAGLDRVELLVESDAGDLMRLLLPTKVDARNAILLAEVEDFVGREGHVAYA